MAYFPFFTDIKDKSCLIVGGAYLVLEKAERLLPYEVKIDVIIDDENNDEDSLSEIKKIDVTILKEKFDIAMLENYEFVVICSSDINLNKIIADECKNRRIPVNSVDDVENCTFIFPALIKKGKLSIGISSSGASPFMTRYIKAKLSEIIPDNTEELLERLESLRPYVKENVPNESQRKTLFKRIFLDFVDSEILPNESDVAKIIEEMTKRNGHAYANAT